MNPNRSSRPIPLSKRIFDLGIALFLILLLSPLYLLTALVILLFLGRPVIFCQTRPGYQGQPFTLYKFRTMRDQKDSQGQLLPDSERLTSLGKFLRSTSIDELPEFFNVLKGDLSLVGPRPLLMKYLPLYSAEQARRHEVLPGITGWAQVHGRNTLSWEEKFKLDVWYVDHWSFALDLKIIALTVWKILKREGISQEGQATAEEFKGTPG